MAIKFGDTLENQNTAYPIVDVVGDNVAGIHIIDDFANDHLIAIPANARRTGSIIVAKDTGKAYIFTGTGDDITGDNNSSNEWGHAAGTNWVPAGSTTLGSPSSGNLTDNSPAIASFTADTLIVDAIDQLNETLGNLVPTSPAAWSTKSGLSIGISTSAARLIGKNTSGSALSHSVNGNAGLTTTAGTVVAWDVDEETTSSQDYSKTFSFTGGSNPNNLAQTQLRFHLNDQSVELASATATSATLAAGSHDDGGSLTLNVTTGDFPNTGGDSDGFFTGVASFTVAANDVSTDGYNVFKVDDSGGNNPVTQTIYIAADGNSASVVSLNTAGGTILTKTANGTAGYTSGLPCFKDPTFKLEVSTGQLIPNNSKVYGASSSTSDNNCVTFGAGDVCNAPSALTYADLPNSTNANVQQNDNFSSHDITGVTTRADQYRLFSISQAGSPTITAKSIHGSSSATAVGTGNTEYYYFYDQPSNTSDLLAPFENNLMNTLHTSDTAGARVKDPDTNGNSEDTPSDAVGSYGAWSQQYGNNSSSSFSIKNHDAITSPQLGTGTNNALRVTHSIGDFTNASFVYADTVPAALDLTGRTQGDAQYITYAFPCNQPLQKFDFKFKGDLDGGGNVFFKIFDASSSNSLLTANSSGGNTGGWVPATVSYAGTGIAGAGGTGCASGGVLDVEATSLQTIEINAGSGRWNAGSDAKVYVRVKLMSGDFIEQIGCFEQ